ncbi:hypothetical protein KKB55_09280 [Myxococcota bacterium]|nr:hypothetical protein [Myxococcota bacterium]MBU1897927.1 hypothetical protein [Myxococcota bacterium]
MSPLLLTLALWAPTPLILQPFEAFPLDQAQAVASALRAYGFEVTLAPTRPLPKAAYYPPRKRYRADRLLAHLNALHPEGKILGLTTRDISTTKGAHQDWGVFGLGELGGRAAMVSTHRLKRGARDAAHRLRRLRHTAIHEVGHLVGLPHCEEPDCLMQDAHGSIKNTDTSDHLGPDCLRRWRALNGLGEVDAPSSP